MKIKKTASGVWNEYQRGMEYKVGLNLYDIVKQNENFFNGKQWEGVKAPDLPKPVFNFLKPVVSYYTAMLISDDIAANVEIMNTSPDAGNNDVTKVISTEIDNIMEHTNIRFLNRKMIRNCAVDGDACFYVWFDTEEETGFKYNGNIKVDLIDNTNVYFGDTSNASVQEQPYIIIAYRKLLTEIQDEAAKHGVSPDEITADTESQYMNSEKDYDNEYVTVLLKLWKEKGRIWMMKSTEKTVIIKPVNTGYRLYPIAFMNWEAVKNSYHGESPITSAIQNQIFVNKLYAMAMIQTQNSAFPKIVYDKRKIDRWDGRPGRDVGVTGDPAEAVFSAWKAPDMSAYVTQLIDSTIKYTKDLMGASDAALGNVNPDNTSAIIAVQKAAGMPLDIQRMDFYNFVESYIRIFIDIMREKYGLRYVTLTDTEGNREAVEFDFAELENYVLSLKIDIGQAAYWNELTQIQTLDNLMDRKILPDALTYLESMPDGYIKNKQEIIQKIKETMQNALTGQSPMLEGGALSQEVAAADTLQEPGAAGLTDEEVAKIASELAGMGDEEAIDVLESMQIAEEEKERIVAAYAEITGSPAGPEGGGIDEL